MANAHRHIADRLLHGIDADALTPVQKIALAHAHAQLAVADEQHTRNLVAAFRLIEHLPPLARLMILAQVRRRLGLLPPAPEEASTSNGGQ